MPAEYEAKRDELVAKGVSLKDAKRQAAIWYNVHFKNRTPVTRNYEKTKRRRYEKHR